ncbi:putative hydroxymethylpyrimidine-binding protein, partial [Vibrio parahaemolyticus V-223/04]
HPN